MNQKSKVSGHLSSLISDEVSKPAKSNNKPATKKAKAKNENKNSMEYGIRDGFTRKTIVLRKSMLDKIRIISALENKKITDFFDEVLTDKIKAFEKKHGKVEVYPQTRAK
ncbi:hypothetical protein ES702_04423 [subsurface metagenome]